jgi:putative SOS response-associated peptidase YedK
MGEMNLYGLFAAEPDPIDAASAGKPSAEAGPAEAKPAGSVEPAAQGSSAPRVPAETLAEKAEVDPPAPDRPDLAAGRYNIAPTTTVPVVLERRIGDDERPHRVVRGMRWGLVPSWAKDVKIGNRMFNARSDSVLAKPVFRTPMQKRRCLVPASGYYEWRTVPGPDGKPLKHPFYITPADGSVLAFAGLWEFWRSPDGEPLTSVTIITTDAVGDLRGIHDRMPLILPATEWDAWLDMDNPATAVAPLLESPDPKLIEQLELRPVSPRVGNVRNDDPSLLARVVAG